MALMLVDGFVKLVLTLGPHPNAPLELYMNRGDRLDDRQWHTVEVIRSLKVGTTFKLRFFLVVNISNPSDIIDHATTFLYFLRTLRLEIVPDFVRAHSLVDILSFSRERREKINKLWSITRTEKFCLALGLFCCFSRRQWYSIMLREKYHPSETSWKRDRLTSSGTVYRSYARLCAANQIVRLLNNHAYVWYSSSRRCPRGWSLNKIANP